jgi:hypothetical protein
VVDSPAVADADLRSNEISDVTCVSASDCWAVGRGSHNLTLTVHWDGTTWTIVPSPPVSTTFSIFRSVDCVSTSDCWAVGESDLPDATHPIYEHWDGQAWSVVASDPAVTLARPQGVECVTSDDCWSVGLTQSAPGAALQTLAEHWDGSSWTIVPTPNTSTTRFNGFRSIACPTTDDCWAVGEVEPADPEAPYEGLIQHWDGTSWAIIAFPPNPENGTNTVIWGVTCLNGSDCWAVGLYALHWGGAAWSAVSMPSEPDTLHIHGGVSCVSSSDCWAVGGNFSLTQSTNAPLADHWDGSSWSTVTTPFPGAVNGGLAEVDCTSSSSCWATGGFKNSGPGTLGLRWDGTTWSVQTMAVPQLAISPTSGSPGTALTASGWGFPRRLHETVTVKYKTGLANPKSVVLCSAVTKYKAFSCAGTIPSAPTAGAAGVHQIVATGSPSGTKVKVDFTLT